MANHNFEKEKTQQLLAYLASKVDIGKTKLMKLLYLIDFTAYERTGKSVTNDQYKHWALGPVPENVWQGMKGELVRNVLESIREDRGGVGNYIRYTPIMQSPDISLLNKDEMAIVDEVIQQYGQMGQQELVDLLHKELPYIITQENETIPYFLASYRTYTRLTKKELEKIQNNKVFIAKLKSAYKESQKESESEFRPATRIPNSQYGYAAGF